MNSYDLSRSWFDFAFDNPEKIRPIHAAIYFFAIEHCNRLGWKEKFGLPSQMVMEAIGVKNWRTYSSGLNDLVAFGFIIMIETSKNQYSSNIIAIVNFTKASTKALDKALSKHVQKQGTKQGTKQGQSTVSIDKPINNKQINNKYMDSINDEIDFEDPDLVIIFHGVVKLSCFEFDKLITQFSKKAIDNKIQSLATGIHNADKKYLGYKNHYMTLLNWLKRDGNSKESNLPNTLKFNSPIL